MNCATDGLSDNFGLANVLSITPTAAAADGSFGVVHLIYQLSINPGHPAEMQLILSQTQLQALIPALSQMERRLVATAAE